MEYILQPRFSQKRLKQVWLASGDQCSNDAISVFNRLSSGLAVKYPQVIFEKDMRESDISRANLNARRSGEKQTISQIYASDKVVVLLTFAFSNERPPPFPTARSRFALAAYEIVRSNFEARKQECSGTGNKRMDIALQYMTRRDFEAKASETSESIRARQDQLVDQL
ncbi:hypothetical protein [Qipengyuania sp. DGS5-3]|uniref:hypothetical protein n=1 Tax=Qipengyuania sp. DGS5-3 TaxID=3349632 RepID=UPI0036D2A92A